MQYCAENLKIRESNFELLRIIAMVMVLILHADFVALGHPDSVEIQRYPIISVIRIFFLKSLVLWLSMCLC